MTKDTVLIPEPNFSGHRWRYAEWAADACVEAGFRCLIVTSSENAQHPLAQRIAAAGLEQLRIAFVDPPEQPSRAGLGALSYVRFFRDFRYLYQTVSRECRVAFVVVPFVDYFLYALPFLGSPFGTTPWIGITMLSSFHHHQVGVRAPRRLLTNTVKAGLFRRALGTPGMKALLTIDPSFHDWYAARRPGQHATAVHYLADPFPDTVAVDPAEARRRLQLSGGQHLLVYGAITDKKGIRELFNALSNRRDAPRVVIAGEQDADMRAYLEGAVARLTPAPVIFDRFIPEDLERDLFSACDAIWIGYKGHYGMSGVLVQAYRFNKPVIATADGLIGWFCRNGELGPVIADHASDTINRALDQLFVHGAASRLPAAARANHLLAQNTLSHFKKTLQLAIA